MERFRAIEGRSGNASALVRSVVTLPTHPRVSPAYAERLAACLGEVLSQRGVAAPALSPALNHPA